MEVSLKTPRRFFLTFTASLGVFLLCNFIIWKGWTELLLSPQYKGGDLTRLGYVAGLKVMRDNTIDLPLKHLEMKEYRGEAVDMLTLGDSFSAGIGEGKNRFYQDYIASLNSMSVLNVPTYKFKTMIWGGMPVLTLAALYQSGYLDIIKPRYVLLETVERFAIQRLVTYYNFDIQVPLATLERYYRETTFDGELNQGISFVNEGNFKFLYYRFMYNFSEHAFRRLVIKTQLTRPMFSGNHGDILLAHGDELRQGPLATVQNIRTANDNLNEMARLLRKKGITLVFMPVVDKLNLYRPYMKNKSYPQSVFFEELRTLPKEYLFIDTKDILSKALAAGEQDIFFQDDTHWSWNASQRIFSTIRFERNASGFR